MRHIRDPVTGRCVVCDKQHNWNPTTSDKPNDPNSKATWDNVRKKMIYVNAFSRPATAKRPGNGVYLHNTSPPPGSPTPSRRDPDSDSGVHAGSVVSTSNVRVSPSPRPTVIREHYYQDGPNGKGPGSPPPSSASPPPGTKEFHHWRNSSRGSPPRSTRVVHHGAPARGRDTERHMYYGGGGPQGGMYRDDSPEGRGGCCGGGNRGRDSFGHNSHMSNGKVANQDPYVSKYRGSNYRGASTGGGIGKRRCCTALMALLLLLLLAGLIAGLYFGIKAAKENEAKNSPEVVYAGQGGYYVNGVYVIPVTQKPSEIFLIYGDDVPCNEFNNNTDVTEATPNCNDVTTRIVASNWTTTTTTTVTPEILVENGASRYYVTSGLSYLSLMSSLFCICGFL